jgi:hypothetical protein
VLVAVWGRAKRCDGGARQWQEGGCSSSPRHRNVGGRHEGRAGGCLPELQLPTTYPGTCARLARIASALEPGVARCLPHMTKPIPDCDACGCRYIAEQAKKFFFFLALLHFIFQLNDWLSVETTVAFTWLVDCSSRIGLIPVVWGTDCSSFPDLHVLLLLKSDSIFSCYLLEGRISVADFMTMWVHMWSFLFAPPILHYYALWEE